MNVLCFGILKYTFFLFFSRPTWFTTCFHLCTCNHDSIKRRVFEGKIIRKVYDIIRSIFYQTRLSGLDRKYGAASRYYSSVHTKYRSLYNYLSYIMQQWHEMSDYFGWIERFFKENRMFEKPWLIIITLLFVSLGYS